MSTQATPFEDLMKLGQDWTNTMAQASESFTPEMMEKIWPTMPKEAMETFFGKALNPGGLDAKTRLLMTLLGLVIQGSVAETQIRLTMRHAIEAGATPQELTETIGMAALFGGVAGVSEASALLAEVTKNQEGDA